jgi:hypothetical protein
MVTGVVVVTAFVVTVNVAVVLPAFTVTVGGTVAAALLPDNVTTAPPPGAGPVRVTVPVDGLPPTTLVGFRDTLVKAAEPDTVSVAVCCTPL